MAGILPAVWGGILPPGWKPDDTAAKMAAATGARRCLAATPGHRPWDAPDVGAMAVATLTGRVLGPGHPGR